MDSSETHHSFHAEFPIVHETKSPEKNRNQSRRQDFSMGGVLDHHENAYHVRRSHFPLPSVTVSSDPKRAREKREREHRRCTAGRIFRWTLIGFAIGYCKEISGFMNGMVPQTVISTPRVQGDYTSIKGIHDLSSRGVNPLCFSGVVDCPCQDPLVPVKGTERIWTDTHLTNQRLTQSERAIKVDVVFYGDSITEGWHETSLGMPEQQFEGTQEVFDSLFKKNKGGKYKGLALGIAGDTSPMLLWRIQNGELPSNINPSVFWLLIGTNDIGRTWCSPEMVVLGVIRNVEEILSQRPSARVVINGLFPRSFNKDGFVAKGGSIKPSVWEDIKAINSELKMYATYRNRVSYFETKVFFKDPKAPQLQIDKELMPDMLHPSPAGYKRWGEEIVAKLDALLVVEDEAEGETEDEYLT